MVHRTHHLHRYEIQGEQLPHGCFDGVLFCVSLPLVSSMPCVCTLPFLSQQCSRQSVTFQASHLSLRTPCDDAGIYHQVRKRSPRKARPPFARAAAVDRAHQVLCPTQHRFRFLLPLLASFFARRCCPFTFLANSIPPRSVVYSCFPNPYRCDYMHGERVRANWQSCGTWCLGRIWYAVCRLLF